VTLREFKDEQKNFPEIFFLVTTGKKKQTGRVFSSSTEKSLYKDFNAKNDKNFFSFQSERFFR